MVSCPSTLAFSGNKVRQPGREIDLVDQHRRSILLPLLLHALEISRTSVPEQTQAMPTEAELPRIIAYVALHLELRSSSSEGRDDLRGKGIAGAYIDGIRQAVRPALCK